MAHEGDCLCGKTRYQAHVDSLHVVHCHCAMCRRTSGARRGAPSAPGMASEAGFSIAKSAR